jgi:protein-disulfide isomerase
MGQFRAFVDEVFQEQASLDERKWGQLALAAGIADTVRISTCARADSIPQGIRDGLSYGQQFELEGTPTVLIDGWEYPNPPSPREMELALESLSKGKRPHALPRR